MAATATQIMLVGFTSWDRVRDVDNIIAEMETGIFLNSARLVDQVLRDGRLCSTAFTRVYGLLGKPKKFNPAPMRRGRKTNARKPRRDDFATRIAEETEDDFPQMAPHDVLAEMLIWGIVHGFGLAQIIQESDCWYLEVWHPWAVYWREDLRCYVVMTRENSEVFIEPDGNGCFFGSDGTRWVLYTPYGYANAFRRGLLRAAARLYLERQWFHRDRARYSEVHGQPMRVGTAPAEATDSEVDKYKSEIDDVGSEVAVVVRKGAEGNQWGLELLEAKGKSGSLFENAIAQLDKEIATLFLGQSQTTDGQAGLGANEMAGEPVRLDIMKADGDSLAQCLRTQFLTPYCEWAYGRGDLAPELCWHVDPPEDRAKKALQFKDLMTGLAIATDKGFPVDVRETLEDFGVAMITEAEQKALDAQKAAEAAQAAAAAPTVGTETPPKSDGANGKSDTPAMIPAQSSR